MILKILLNLTIVLLTVVIVVLFKSFLTYKKVPTVQNNIVETSRGILSIIHENNSKKVSASIKGAEDSLKLADVNEFSINVFFESLNK